MPLEATMIIIDNSEYMRNGDYQPSRYLAQSDAVNVIFGRKTNSNPENTVGLMTMAGKTPQVLATPTTDIGKILSALHDAKISDECDLQTGLQVAQLALKHRQNKNQRQRIIAFVGSPLFEGSAGEEKAKALTRLAKKLKKNNVAVDMVVFGEEDEIELNEGKLRSFIDILQGDSHYVQVPASPHLLMSDVIVSSPILSEDGGGVGSMGNAGASSSGPAAEQFEFGVDPSLDPELAMALRMSLDEERARIAAQQAASAPAAAAAEATTLSSIPEGASSEPAAKRGAPAPEVQMQDEDDEDEQLTRAILLSQANEAGDTSVVVDHDQDMQDADDEAMSEEEAIQKAIEMSMMEEEQSAKKDSKKP